MYLLNIYFSIYRIEKFEYFLGLGVAKDKRRKIEIRRVKGRANFVIEGYQTALSIAAKSTSDLRKQQRKSTMSPQETAAKRPEQKRPKTSMSTSLALRRHD